MQGGRLTVAVTGAGGLVGSALVPQLQHHDLRLLDRRADRARGIRRVDARRLRPLARALEGCDVVVDLASDARSDAPWEAVWRNNIRIIHTVLEAARLAGVRRVVHASSNQVAAAFESDQPWAAVLAGDLDDVRLDELVRLPPSTPPRPRSAYGTGKALSEAACRWYAEAHGLSTVCLRIGTVNAVDRPTRPRHFATWLSHRDLAGYVEAAITAPPDLPATVAWAVSANTWRIWETGAVSGLDYEPVDDAESFR